MTNIDPAAERALVLAIQSSAAGTASGTVLATAADFRHFLIQDDPEATANVVNSAQAVVDAYNGSAPQVDVPVAVDTLERHITELRNPV